MRTAYIFLVLSLICTPVQTFALDRLLTADQNVKFPYYNTRLGGQGSTAIYTMSSDKAWVVQEAEYQLALGSDTFKFMLRPYINKYSGIDIHTQEMPPYTEPVHSLVDRAKNVPAFRTILDMPFKYTMIWAFPVAGLNDDQTGIYASKAAGINLGDGYSQAEAQIEYKELYDLTRYLMQTYQNTDRNFLIGNWEGDWVLLAGQGDLPRNKDKKNKRNFEPSEEKIEAMRAWFANRQKAVEDARNSLPNIKGVRVYHYVEVNHFEFAMDDKKGNGDNRLVNAVLPFIKVDAVSYSSWSATNDVKKLPQRLHDHLNFIEKNANFTGYWPFEKAVFIGEYGLKNADDTAKAINAAAQWGCPFMLYWCILPNYPTNDHYMVEKDGTLTAAYHIHNEALAKIIAQRDITRAYLRRNPTEKQLNALLADFQNIDIPSILASTLNSDEFADIVKAPDFVQALFTQLLIDPAKNSQLVNTVLNELETKRSTRFDTLLKLMDSSEFKDAVSDNDFANWLCKAILSDNDPAELETAISSLASTKRSVLWQKVLNSQNYRTAVLKSRFKNTPRGYKDWIYENTVSNEIYYRSTVDLRPICP